MTELVLSKLGYFFPNSSSESSRRPGIVPDGYLCSFSRWALVISINRKISAFIQMTIAQLYLVWYHTRAKIQIVLTCLKLELDLQLKCPLIVLLGIDLFADNYKIHRHEPTL